MRAVDKYRYTPYDPLFLHLFDSERARLKRQLGPALAIEHIGSTAVVGLGGKGIIDMYVVAPGSDFSELAEALQAAGYEHRPRGDQPGKRFFRTDKVEADGHQQRYHIHLAGSDHPDYHRTIAFRDYLRTNAAARERYAAAKQKAAVVADGNGEVYMRIKESVIGALLAEARMPGLS